MYSGRQEPAGLQLLKGQCNAFSLLGMILLYGRRHKKQVKCFYVDRSQHEKMVLLNKSNWQCFQYRNYIMDCLQRMRQTLCCTDGQSLKIHMHEILQFVFHIFLENTVNKAKVHNFKKFKSNVKFSYGGNSNTNRTEFRSLCCFICQPE